MSAKSFGFQKAGHLASVTTFADFTCKGQKAEDITALWDTGSECTCISEKLAKRLGLEATPIDMNVVGINEERRASYVIGDLYLNGGQIHLQNVCFFVLPTKQLKQNIIIGMDVIGLGIFHVQYDVDADGTLFAFQIDDDMFSVYYEGRPE